MKNKLIEIVKLIFGSMLVALAISNIHARYSIAEGGQLGIELLLFNWFNLSPAISAFLLDGIIVTTSFFVLGKKYFSNGIIGMFSYSLFYALFQHIPYLIPNLSNHLIVATILGGVLVGIGCGLVVSSSGACGGDDSLALMISRITKLNLAFSYLLLDMIVILMSLTYLSGMNIVYSLLTSTISSFIIGFIFDKDK